MQGCETNSKIDSYIHCLKSSSLSCAVVASLSVSTAYHSYSIQYLCLWFVNISRAGKSFFRVVCSPLIRDSLLRAECYSKSRARLREEYLRF